MKLLYCRYLFVQSEGDDSGMKKYIVLITLIGLFLLMLPLAANAVPYFSLTSGTPIGESAAVDYDTDNLWTDGKEVKIHAFTQVELNNYYYRYSLAYTAPKGYELTIFSEDNEHQLFSEGGLTSSSQSIAQFDLHKTFKGFFRISFFSQNEADAAGMFFVSFENKNASQKGPYFSLTDGIPIGDSKTVDYDTGNLWTDGKKVIINAFTRVKLNNNSYRYSLVYTAPQGYELAVFDNESGYQLFSEGGLTTASQSLVQFDIQKTLEHYFIISFFSDNEENGSGRFYISFKNSNWQAAYTWSSDYRQATVTLTEPDLNLTRTETTTEIYLLSESIDEGLMIVAEFPTEGFTTRKRLKTLRLPAGIVEVEEEAFMGNNSYEAVIIPSTCRKIKSRAFAMNKNLKFVFAIDVERASDAFEGCENIVFIDNSRYLSSTETSNPQIGDYIDYWDGDWYYWGKFY